MILFLRISIKTNLRTKKESMTKKNAARTGSIVKRIERWKKKKRRKGRTDPKTKLKNPNMLKLKMNLCLKMMMYHW